MGRTAGTLITYYSQNVPLIWNVVCLFRLYAVWPYGDDWRSQSQSSTKRAYWSPKEIEFILQEFVNIEDQCKVIVTIKHVMSPLTLINMYFNRQGKFQWTRRYYQKYLRGLGMLSYQTERRGRILYGDTWRHKAVSDLVLIIACCRIGLICIGRCTILLHWISFNPN